MPEKKTETSPLLDGMARIQRAMNRISGTVDFLSDNKYHLNIPPERASEYFKMLAAMHENVGKMNKEINLLLADMKGNDGKPFTGKMNDRRIKVFY